MLNMKGLCIFISLFSCLFCLASCQVVNCPGKAPSGCKCTKILGNLKVVCTGETSIKDIPSWLPQNTTRLAFEGCDIRSLGQDSFNNLVNLERIKIQKQQGLMFNDSLVFQGLNDLDVVDFESCLIDSLPAALFANLPHLETVGLSSNPLAALPDDLLENSTNIKFLRIENTQLNKDVIAKIGEGHFGKNIKSLAMYGTRIQRLEDGLFSGLPKLNAISISNCEIEYVNADVFKGTEVTSLILDGNPIKSINENAFRDSKISTFKCNNCQLTSNVTFNGFLKKMLAVGVIHLQNNKLTHIPKNAFTGLKVLRIIDLSNNSIGTIEENPFANLPECKNVNCIQLQDNPLNCDCNLAWLRVFADKIEDHEKSNWVCSNPQSVYGKRLVLLKPDQFCCGGGNMKKCGSGTSPTTKSMTSPDPNSGWIVPAPTLLAIVLQLILVMFGMPSHFA